MVYRLRYGFLALSYCLCFVGFLFCRFSWLLILLWYVQRAHDLVFIVHLVLGLLVTTPCVCLVPFLPELVLLLLSDTDCLLVVVFFFWLVFIIGCSDCQSVSVFYFFFFLFFCGVTVSC